MRLKRRLRRRPGGSAGPRFRKSRCPRHGRHCLGRRRCQRPRPGAPQCQSSLRLLLLAVVGDHMHVRIGQARHEDHRQAQRRCPEAATPSAPPAVATPNPLRMRHASRHCVPAAVRLSPDGFINEAWRAKIPFRKIQTTETAAGSHIYIWIDMDDAAFNQRTQSPDPTGARH